jgi:antitoxin VapB
MRASRVRAGTGKGSRARCAIAKTRTFRSGNSEAVRLPKDVAFGEGVELVVVRSGDVVTLYPAATSIPEMIARLAVLPRPPSIEERDDEELPERPGL